MRIFVDCDPGIDDSAALVYLMGLHLQGLVELVGVSAVGGNVPAAQTLRNAALLLALAGLEAEVPLYQGFDSPELPTNTGFHGVDGLGGRFFAHPKAPGPVGHDAADVVARLSSAGEVTVLCTGPLTNAALWVDALEGREDVRWVVMGGATAGHPGNVRDGVEFNFGADAHAAKVFFERARRVVVVPLNVTQSIGYPSGAIDRIAVACPWLAALLRDSTRVHRLHGSDVAWLHDLTAAYVAVNPATATLERGVIGVDGSPTGGLCVVDVAADGPHSVVSGLPPQTADLIASLLQSATEACVRNEPTLAEMERAGVSQVD